MSARKININSFGQDLTLIREIVKPFWIKFLNDNGIGPKACNQLGWNFTAFCEELALELRIKDQRN